MKNEAKQANEEPEIILSTKEKLMEFTATALCFLLLFASFMKVMFF